MRRVRVMFDANPMGTRIYDADTGEQLYGVTKINIEQEAGGPPLARIETLAQVVAGEVTVEVQHVEENGVGDSLLDGRGVRQGGSG